MSTGFSYEVQRQGQETILVADATTAPIVPSIEDNPACMSEVVDQLVKTYSNEKSSSIRVILVSAMFTDTIQKKMCLQFNCVIT